MAYRYSWQSDLLGPPSLVSCDVKGTFLSEILKPTSSEWVKLYLHYRIRLYYEAVHKSETLFASHNKYIYIYVLSTD